MINYYNIISMMNKTIALNPETLAFINAAGITDSIQINAINQLVINFKGYNIWTKIKAAYPFIGGTASSHKYNLKDPRDLDAAFRLIFTGGWVHDATGSTPNGINAYADTKLIINNVMPANSVSAGIYFGTLPTKSSSMNGSWGSTQNAFYRSTLTGNYFYWGGGEIGFNVPVLTNNGLQQVSRINTTQILRKHKSDSVITNSATYVGNSTNNFYIGTGNGYNDYEDRTISFVYLADGLTSIELDNMYNAIQNFNITLLRQV